MLRIPLLENEKNEVSWFLCFLVSWLLGFLVLGSWFLGSWLLRFLVSGFLGCWFLGFCFVSRVTYFGVLGVLFLGFKDYRFLGFLISRNTLMCLKDILSILQKIISCF